MRGIKVFLVGVYLLMSTQILFSWNFFKSVAENRDDDTEKVLKESYQPPTLQNYISLWEEPKEQLLGLDNILSSTSYFPTTTYPLTITTQDGLKRSGVLTLRKHARGNVVLCHPAAYDKDFMISYQDRVFVHYNCVRFDFRRHGENKEGQYSTIGKKEVYEVEAVVNFLKSFKQTKDLPTYGFGISMGASVLIEYQAWKHNFDALILQAPFDSLENQIRRTFPVFRKTILRNFIFSEPVRWYGKAKYKLDVRNVNPIDSIKKIKVPVFLMHSKDDPIIPHAVFEKFAKVGKCIKKTWAPAVGFHSELFKTYPDLYIKRCNDFLYEVD
jgi:uncharacterized protein